MAISMADGSFSVSFAYRQPDVTELVIPRKSYEYGKEAQWTIETLERIRALIN